MWFMLVICAQIHEEHSDHTVPLKANLVCKSELLTRHL